MKKKTLYLLSAFILIATILVIAFFLMASNNKSKNEKLTEEFLTEIFTNTEDNIEIFQNLEAVSSVIGEGVDSETQAQSQESSARAEQEFQEKYGKYLNSNGLEDFHSGLSEYIYELYDKNKVWSIQELEVSEDNNKYKFHIVLSVGNEEKELNGRIELIDKKISKIGIESPVK